MFLFWNSLSPFRVAAAQCKSICPEWPNWPGSWAGISDGTRSTNFSVSWPKNNPQASLMRQKLSMKVSCNPIEQRIRSLLMKRIEAKAKHCQINSDLILLIFIYRCKHNLVKVLVSIKNPFCNQRACYKISWFIKISWSNKISWFIKISWFAKISWFTKIRWQWFLNIQTEYETKTSNLTRSL